MWYFLALGIQSLTLTFPFSQAMSVSRKSFYLGTLGLFAVIALAYSVLYYVLGLIEKATGGWGMDGQLFALGWIAENNAAVQILFYFVAMVLLFMIGFWCATMYLRWKATGMLVVGIGFAVRRAGPDGAGDINDWWVPVVDWLGSLTTLWGSPDTGGHLRAARRRFVRDPAAGNHLEGPPETLEADGRLPARRTRGAKHLSGARVTQGRRDTVIPATYECRGSKNVGHRLYRFTRGFGLYFDRL